MPISTPQIETKFENDSRHYKLDLFFTLIPCYLQEAFGFIVQGDIGKAPNIWCYRRDSQSTILDQQKWNVLTVCGICGSEESQVSCGPS